MASACVNNVGIPPENFLDCSVVYGWLSPRLSFGRDIHDDEPKKATTGGAKALRSLSAGKRVDPAEASDPESSGNDFGDFEFRLEDPVTMLPADELFSDGKLVPLQLSVSRPAAASTVSSEVRSPDTLKSCRRTDVVAMDPFLLSPKAPSCSSRWKELLGLKKLYQNSNAKPDSKSASSQSTNNGNCSKSRKLFLHRSSKSSGAAIETSLSLPLLKDLLDSESVSTSSRLSLSSSSSGHEHDDLPRLSLDPEKPSLNQNPISLSRNPNSSSSNPPRVRVIKPRAVSSENRATARVGRSPIRRAPDSSTVTVRGLSVDSPRMNSSGKIVFQGLERSSSSPSTFNGGPRFKHRGMERSYSANVRVTPVLNVPVCSLRVSSKSSVFGFQLFSSPQKREGGSSAIGGNRGQQANGKGRADRA